MIRSGELKNRVELQAQVRTPDGMGGFSNSWLTICTLWAAIWPVRATEVVEGARPVATVTHRIRIRYRNGISPKLRVKFGSKYFSVESVINPNTDYKALDLMAREVV
jgi:SPP1 family predicted phage head-tail adaptor